MKTEDNNSVVINKETNKETKIQTTKEIIKILETHYPRNNAESWDNIGLLIGNENKKVKKIQFSIDLTMNAIENAIAEKVDMVITHHPFIFNGIKNILDDNFLGKKIIKVIKNDINVFAIHTNLDSTIGGLNDFILEKIGIFNSKILSPAEDNKSGIGRMFKLTNSERIIDFALKLKNSLKIDNMRYIGDNIESEIKKIAIINGSAMSYWKKAKFFGVELFVTSDITYHDALDLKESGMHAIDFGHFESERMFGILLEDILKNYNLEIVHFNDGPIFKNIF